MLARTLSALALAVLAFPLGCAPTTGPGAGHDEGEGLPGERTATTSEAITSNDALSRAQEWVTAKLLYCQSPNGKADPDTSCPATCNRESNPQWDPYRSDCSGFVSWAWGLAAPGLVTSEFAPFDTSVSQTIQASDLQPGDACNLTAGGHIVLFVAWVTPGKSATFMEEPGCSATPDYAHEFTSDVTLSGVNIDIAYEGESFTAIRFDQMTQSPLDAGTGPQDDAGSASSSGAGGTKDAGGTQADAGSGSGGSSSSGGSTHEDGGGGTSSGSSSGVASSGGSSGSAGSASRDAGASTGNGGTSSDDGASLETGGGGMGCDVGGGSSRGGQAGVALLMLGLVLARRRGSR
jgi:MYXO-CTERM domain-containing protein